VSHDRYFLNRVCTDILAFPGDGRIHHSVGDYDYYVEKRQRALAAAARPPVTQPALPAAPPPRTKPRKLSFKEARELEGMEAQILAVEEEIARIEALFVAPDFHRTHGPQTNQLKDDLAAAKDRLAALYARWEELERRRVAAATPPAD